MNHLQKLICLVCILPMFFMVACEDSNSPTTCTYALELQDESTALSNAASAYGTDPSAANCQAFKQAYENYLNEAEKLDDCVPQADRAEYRQAIDQAQAGLNDLTC